MSDPNYPWETIAEANGSLRWWKKSGETGHMKGSIKLQQNTDTSDCTRMAYDGHWAGNPHSVAWATLALPHSSTWAVDHSKFKSNNAKARAIRIAFCQAGNKTGLLHLQITIPFDGDGKAEKQFVDAVLLAATV